MKKQTKGRDIPLPPTLPKHLRPYDTNNDGILSEKEELKYREAMMYKKLEQAAKDKEKKLKKKKPKSKKNYTNGKRVHPLIVIN
tara:strand:- start:1468 stop:1719 length:252 start_codon:yes stop_codon:yes gene_type:complete